MRQNDRLIVSISGRNLERRLSRGGAARPAAGRLRDRDGADRGDGEVLRVPVKITETRIAEARDDRFFAALDLGRRPYRSWWDSDEELKHSINSFHVAYIVRAVTPGSFLPAANVSDMYAPRIHGRTAMGRVEIAPR